MTNVIPFAPTTHEHVACCPKCKVGRACWPLTETERQVKLRCSVCGTTFVIRLA